MKEPQDKIDASIILPVYNAEATIELCLESIERQTVRPLEVIIIDDGSTDGTRNKIQRWISRLPIQIIGLEKNGGLIAALQEGVKSASGRLLVRVDGDDIWLPDHLSVLNQLSKENPNGVLFATRALFRDQDVTKEDKLSPSVTNESIRWALQWDNPLVHSAVAIDRQRYFSVGGYKGPKHAEDYSLWIRLTASGEFVGSAKVTVIYNVSPNSVSRIARAKSLATRMQLQLDAISAFWSIRPLLSLLYLVTIGVRMTVLKLKLGSQ